MNTNIDRYLLAEKAGTEGVWDWDLRSDTLYLSPRFKEFLGLPPGESGRDANRPTDWLSLVHPEDVDWLHASFEGQMVGLSVPFQIEHRVRRAADTIENQQWRWLVCRGMAVMDDSGEPIRLVGSVADITDRKHAEQELRRSEERYALAAAGAADGLWDWFIDSGEIYYSPRWKAMLGFEEAEIAGSTDEWFQRVLPGDLDGLRTAIDLHLVGDRSHLQHEFRILDKAGQELWMLVRGLAVRDDKGCAVRMAGSMTDITARKKAEQQILFDAVHDSMTGLPNRTLLLDRIGQALDRNRRAGARPFATILIDLDRFKAINDALGASVGDRVLRIVAKRLDVSRRVGDTLARLSADEFAVLVDELDDAGDALEAAERMARAISRPVTLGEGHDVVLTASIGVALSQTGYDRAEDMLRDASLAMYRAKSGGRARIDVFDTNLRRQAMAAMRMEADLRAALEQGQLCLHYQPIVLLETGAI
ncbi:sensor domain-containing diguanylate cyclase, partial [Azospirillum sp. B506]|uniref:sensor domain-containing protein n=1 Tax=Azospirillum sp. B506 TaxID=137721 RepID=UPI0005B2AD4F